MYVVFCLLVFGISAIDCLKRLISKITCYVSSGTLDPRNQYTILPWDGQPCKLPSSAAALIRPSTRPTLAHNYLWPLSKLRSVSLSQWSTKLSKETMVWSSILSLAGCQVNCVRAPHK